MSDTQLDQRWRIDEIPKPVEQEAHNLYAIIEPVIWPEWHAELFADNQTPIYVPLFEGTPFNNIDNGPVVLCVSKKSNMLKLITTKLESSPCGSLFQSSSNTKMDDLLTTLRNALIVNTDRSSALMRYFEPRTLLPLVSTMTDAERSSVFRHTSQIQWFERQWFSVRISTVQELSEHHAWSLTPEHISTMQSILTQWNGAA
ncbi:DUF4123 domain-containing protein [Vibrio europaeus]|uniref:DUF4123 domain-containing protein n=1 Tax=Vibrio europaeus TaxID=300876 RepID=A0A178J8J4_9VIBR|nr:DUF4123 domain-containing protein [Vibrio europaeus]MDC5705284.1 DUF4123 domain-containing protein [Vibrio europaeus]MDC5710563.1 DUF4123 domain-containing protein [Vibrio europaeus]MDC5715653.1 DUF4123 domain-containing protein [Vibrio europaeus]MDC5719814.1 DUF4123 domain-containing protein [Vibrio europaeus]MDC5724298.1 DUF4123 domain-containing protein [Vibrio europaeus]